MGVCDGQQGPRGEGFACGVANSYSNSWHDKFTQLLFVALTHRKHACKQQHVVCGFLPQICPRAH